MPQVDQVTFLPIVFWTFIIYSGGYLLLSGYAFPTLNAAFKVVTTYYRAITLNAASTKNITGVITFLPWVSLDA